MRIAFIGQKGIPANSGGVERRVEELSTRLAGMGHEVFVYVRDNYTNKDLEKYKKVKLVHLPSIRRKNLEAISHTFLATMHALFQDYDVINYQAPGPSTLSWIIRIFSRKTAVVGTFNSRDCFHKKWGWFARKYLEFGEYAICKFPEKIIVISDALKRYIEEKYGAHGHVISNGAGIKFNANTNELRKFGLVKKGYILYAGRLIRHKGVHYLISAFNELKAERKIFGGMKLAIVGDGFFTDDYVRQLKDLSRGNRHIVFTGKQTGETLEQIFSNAYLFVQPSEAEGLSIALLEAMGCGIAPLISDIPENLEPVDGCGLSFETKNIADLKKMLLYALNNPREIEKLGKMAQEKAGEKYDWEKIAEKTESLYTELIFAKRVVIR